MADLKNTILCIIWSVSTVSLENSVLLNMNWFNQELILENEIRQRFAKKASWELNCCKILPGSGIPDKFLNPAQEFLTNYSTRFRNFS